MYKSNGKKVKEWWLINTFSVIGRITKPINLEYTKTGKPAIKLNLAINNAKDDATFLLIKVFGKQAENISKYCTKGSQLAITGTIRNNNYEDKDGNKHFEYSFIAQNVEFLSNKGNSTTEVEKPQNEPKNESVDTDQVFADFGNLVDYDGDIAF